LKVSRIGIPSIIEQVKNELHQVAFELKQLKDNACQSWAKSSTVQPKEP